MTNSPPNFLRLIREFLAYKNEPTWHLKHLFNNMIDVLAHNNDELSRDSDVLNLKNSWPRERSRVPCDRAQGPSLNSPVLL
jgi:hypothetical protein